MLGVIVKQHNNFIIAGIDKDTQRLQRLEAIFFSHLVCGLCQCALVLGSTSHSLQCLVCAMAVEWPVALGGEFRGNPQPPGQYHKIVYVSHVFPVIEVL